MSKGNLRKLTLLLLSMLTIMAAAIIAPSLPELAVVFHDVPRAELLSKLVLSIPAIFIALSAPVAGRFIDIYGRLPMLVGALILYAVSGSSGLYLDNLYHIIVGRVLLGISIGIILTITITLIGDYYEGEERKAFIGYQSAFVGFAGIIFLAGGGLLADITWRMPFMIYLFPLVLIPLTRTQLSEPPRTKGGSSLKKLHIGTLTRIIFVNSVVFMVLFYVLPTQLPFYLKELGYNLSALSGLALAINAVGMVVASLLYPRLKSRMQFPAVFGLAYLLLAAGFYITGVTSSIAVVVVAMFIAGFGVGCLLPNTNLWVIELTHHELRGRTLGILTTCLFLGQFLSPIVMEPVVNAMGLGVLFKGCAFAMVFMAIAFVLGGRGMMRMHR